MVVHHIDDALHIQPVNVLYQAPEILQRAVVRVDRPVIRDRVGAARRALAGRFADGMDRHQPDDIHAQGLDSLQVPADGFKGPFHAVVADKHRIHYLIAVFLCRIFCHDRIYLPYLVVRCHLRRVSGRR